MCAHKNLEELVAAVATLSIEELEAVEEAARSRRAELEELSRERASRIVERRPFSDRELTAEMRFYRSRRSGAVSENGRYWVFRYREGGVRKTLYLGKTDDPEGEAVRKRG